MDSTDKARGLAGITTLMNQQHVLAVLLLQPSCAKVHLLHFWMIVPEWEKEFYVSPCRHRRDTPERLRSAVCQNPGDPETSLQKYSRSHMPDQKRS